MTDLPPIVTKAYDLALWLLPQVNDFPRSYRFILGDRLIHTMLDLVEGVIEASHRRDKRLLLEDVSAKLASVSGSPQSGFEAVESEALRIRRQRAPRDRRDGGRVAEAAGRIAGAADMKRHGGLFDRLVSFENLLAAAQEARRGKRFKSNTARFDHYLEPELCTLQDELRAQTYRPGPYRTFTIREPKARLISAAPYRDRVVHHALCRAIEPIFERTFVTDSYACRVGKGTHLAVEAFQRHARRYPYVLKCDIAKYFPSMDHEILFNLLTRKIKDQQVLWLTRTIIEASNEQEVVCRYFEGDDLLTPLTRRTGIPIGNLTSQFFANVYLSGFDHFLKEDLRCRAYLRYCDDFVVFGEDKAGLWAIKDAMAEYLARLRLTLHPRKCHVLPTGKGVDVLGYRVWPTHRRLRATTAKRCIRRLRGKARHCLAGALPPERFTQSLASWRGLALHADTYGLRRAVMRNLVELVGERVPLERPFSGKGQAEAGGDPWRVVEQQCEQPAICEPEPQQPDEPEQQHRVPLCEDSAIGGCRSARVSWAGAQEYARWSLSACSCAGEGLRAFSRIGPGPVPAGRHC